MSEKTKKIMTLIIIHDHPKLLFGKKKRGLGVGKWNGFGGKVEEGETIEGAARRELSEEAGIEAGELEKIGINQFEWRNNENLFEIHIFKLRDFKGEPRESDKMAPKWFFADEIPFGEMWADAVYWFPYFMRDKKFKCRFVFDDNNMVAEYSLEEDNFI